jgi:hypothetical protein
MLWQGAKWRILKNFNVQSEECHNYGWNIGKDVQINTLTYKLIVFKLFNHVLRLHKLNRWLIQPRKI